MRKPRRLRTVIPVVLAALALPAQAAAHGRAPTVALDYRLALSPATQTLSGVHVRVLDGDRDFQIRVDPGTDLVVRGALQEPLLKVDSTGVWVNASSPTATSDKLVSPTQHGWIHLNGGRTVVWHDHRLSPPPSSRPGPAGKFVVPVDVNGVPRAISGEFFRVARPAAWPWPAAAALFVAGIVLAIRRRSLRAPLTIGLGVTAGVGGAPRGDDLRRPRCDLRRSRVAPARDGGDRRRGARGAARATPRQGARACRGRRRRCRGGRQPQLDARLLARRRDLGAAGRARARRLRDRHRRGRGRGASQLSP